MKRNAYFQLIHEDDGLYVQSFPATDGGAPLSADDVLHYLELKKYNEYVEPVEIKHFVEDAAKETARLKVSGNPKCLPETETAVITTDSRSLMAKVRLYPPSSKGKNLTEKDLLSLIDQQGVKHGIIKKNVSLLLKAGLYCTDVLIAKATMPVQGTDAEITYHFDAKKTNTPAVHEDGSVDFHKLDMIERVTEGQHLATLKPEVLGTPGTNVRGAAIAPVKVKRLRLKHGKNIHLSEDSLEMYSDVSGNVTLVDDTVFVSNVYEVPADVGPSTGDIDYDGSVEVKGNVLAGYTVKATGDITVNGAVEGAVLESGGKIVLKRGIQGMSKGKMKAERDIISNFIESSEVRAGGRIITDAIMHSQAEAKDEIKVDGKRGLIAGGRVRSTLKISTKVAGSTMGTQTEMEVGTDPTLADRYQRIEKEIEKLASERDSLLQNIDILKKRLKAKGSLSEEKLTLLKTSAMRVQEIGGQMESMTEEYEALEEELAANEGGGRIVVYDVAYPGVKLTISSISTFIHNETKHSAFVRDGADIRVRAI